jgi:hypothetical protein
MKEECVQIQHARHARESGHPVRREASVDHAHFGILDHPLSRMMTVGPVNSDETPNGDT